MIYGTNLKLPKERAYILSTTWERKRLTHMSKNIGEGDVVFYVGAECGDMPALCQAWGAEVAMFEPSEHYWQQIKKIWQMNDFDDPMGFFAGFASNTTRTSGKIDWDDIDMDYENPDNLGFRELSKEANNFPQTKIDHSWENGWKPPTVISIDVEGSEFEVLKGAELTLKAHKPKIYLSLHPEFLFDQWGVYGNDVRNYLKGFGYEETLIDYPPHEVHFYYD